MVFVDSDLVISTLRKDNSPVNHKAREVLKTLFQTYPVKLTIFNYAELFEGTYWSPNVAKSQRILEAYLDKFEIVHFSKDNALEFARISAELELKGQSIGDLDILIASIVIGQKEVLYTRNVKHFDRIPGLSLKNWAEPEDK